MSLKDIKQKIEAHITAVTAGRKAKPVKDLADSTLKAYAAKGNQTAIKELRRRERASKSGPAKKTTGKTAAKKSTKKDHDWGNKKPPFPGAAPPFKKGDPRIGRKTKKK